MTTFTQDPLAGEFILSEANGQLSREAVTIESGQELKAGHVLGQVTSSGKYKEYNPSNADGSETAVAICYSQVDSSGGDVDGHPIVARLSEVNEQRLVWFSGASQAQKDTGKGELKTNSTIVCR